jgi:hypothetical protein
MIAGFWEAEDGMRGSAIGGNSYTIMDAIVKIGTMLVKGDLYSIPKFAS